MNATLLSDAQADILRRERRLVQRLQTTLAGWDADQKDIERLQQAVEQLDEFFLLVFVGEFNSGKSAVINALLGERYLAEGVTPTTAHVHVLHHGEKREPRRTEDGLWLLTYPADFLREVHIVDTPGTNAVLREHEEISRDFVPRSDLVLFVTSADRPFTESERLFLEAIRDWGKKVVIVVNKIDLLETEEERETVVEFVTENAKRLLGTTPDVFPVSARQALARRLRDDGDVPAAFVALEQFLFETLTQEERVRLKLRTPLGVARRVLEAYREKARERDALLRDDLATIEQVERQLSLYREDMEQEFDYHRLRIDRLLNDMLSRGEEFFDETLRLSRIFSLLNSSALREAFVREVIATTPDQIEAQVQDMIDWIVERESRQWRAIARQLGQRRSTDLLDGAAQEAAGGFEYNRRQLLQRVGRATQRVVATYDRTAEARALVSNVQSALTQIAIAEVGAIGLGAAVKVLLVGATADATGLFAAGLLGIAGLGILPYRRNQAKRDLRQKIEALQEQLGRVLQESFEHEIERSVSRMNDAIDPYARFVRTEHKQITDVQEEFDTIDQELHALQGQLAK